MESSHSANGNTFQEMGIAGWRRVCSFPWVHRAPDYSSLSLHTDLSGALTHPGPSVDREARGTPRISHEYLSNVSHTATAFDLRAVTFSKCSESLVSRARFVC